MSAAATLPPLPPDAVLVHIGPHKTGTTAIQTTLAALRDRLTEAGVSYPGGADAHHKPARALTQKHVGWRGSDAPPPVAVWDRLVAKVRELHGRVVISSEFLAGADAEAREKLLDDLGPERVHVLLAARNPASIALSSWQQTLKQGRVGALETWLRTNISRAEGATEPPPFWEGLDPATVVQRWVETVGVERVTVVALDETDRRLLPTTFEHLLDLAPGTLADVRAPMSNRGLTASEAELVRQVNRLLRDRLEWREYAGLVRNGVIRRMVEIRTPQPDEVRPQLPDWAVEQAVAEGTRVSDAIAAAGVRIVGDLATVRTVRQPSAGTSTPPEGIAITTAAEAVVGAVAAATRHSWSLDADRPPEGPPTVPVAPSSDLARELRRRAKAKAKRSYRKLRGRSAPNDAGA